MALFKILSGNSNNFNTDLSSTNLSPAFNEGYCYFIKDNQKLYVDWLDGTEKKRTALVGEKLVIELNENNYDATISDSNTSYHSIKNIKALINEANDKNIPIEITYYDLLHFNSLLLYQTIGDYSFYVSRPSIDVLLTNQIVTLVVMVGADFIGVANDLMEFNALAKTGEEGKIAVYGKNVIEDKDLWYTLHLVSSTGVFNCANSEMDNFITKDNKDLIKVNIEFDEEGSEYVGVKSQFEDKRAFQNSNYTVTLDATNGITITETNGNTGCRFLKVTLLVDNTVTHKFL